MLLHPLLRRVPRRLRRPAGRLLLIGRALLGLLLFVALQVPAAAFVELSPPRATAWLAGLTAAFLLAFARAWGPRAAIRRRRGRLRAPGAALPWLLAAIPPATLASLAVAIVAARSVDPAVLDRPGALAPYEDQPLGWMPVLVLALGYGPLIEEFGFRAWMQGPLERALGTPLAIALTSLVFGAMHGGPASNRVLGGFVCGAAVAVTGSIWSGVLLHVGSNALGMALTSLLPDDSLPPSEAVRRLADALGPTVLHGTLFACSLLLVLVGLRLRRIRGGERVRAG